MRKIPLFITLMLVAVLITVGCTVKKPSDQSLLSAFEDDLLTYGVDLNAGYVRYSVGSDVAKMFQKLGPTEWISNSYYNSKLKVTQAQISDNESDRFPYRGIVTWTWDVLSYHAEGSTEYLFGKKTKTWVRVERATRE